MSSKQQQSRIGVPAGRVHLLSTQTDPPIPISCPPWILWRRICFPTFCCWPILMMVGCICPTPPCLSCCLFWLALLAKGVPTGHLHASSLSCCSPSISSGPLMMWLMPPCSIHPYTDISFSDLQHCHGDICMTSIIWCVTQADRTGLPSDAFLAQLQPCNDDHFLLDALASRTYPGWPGPCLTCLHA